MNDMDKNLIIGIDIRDLEKAKTGTYTYLAEIRRAFELIGDEKLTFHFIDSAFPVYTGKIKVFKWLEHLNYHLWKQIILPIKAWKRKCNVVFCTDSYVPFMKLGYHTIPVIHDAFCFESPENYGKYWLWLYNKTVISAAKKSPIIIVPTIYAQKQISYHTKIPLTKLIVVPEAPKMLLDKEDSSILQENALTKNSYILHVGAIYKRKNIPNLIEAFNRLKQTGYKYLKLVLAGPLPGSSLENDYEYIRNAIAGSPFKECIVTTGYLNNEDLSALYKNALIYVFPSVNEGFGVPILEAFKFKLPVLVANNSCLPEVGGDAVLTFDPYDVKDISLKMQMVIDSPRLQQQMISKGIARLDQFSWQNTAHQLIEIFKSLS